MFNWVDYIEIARTLSQSEGEAQKRAAISRAYYAVYNLASNWLVTRRIPIPEQGNSHYIVWECFKIIKGKERIAAFGPSLRKLRNHVDYKSEPVRNLDKEVLKAITQSEYIANLLKE